MLAKTSLTSHNKRLFGVKINSLFIYNHPRLIIFAPIKRIIKLNNDKRKIIKCEFNTIHIKQNQYKSRN